MGNIRATKRSSNQFWTNLSYQNNQPSALPDAPVLECNVLGIPNITWSSVADATTYNLYRGTVPDGEMLVISIPFNSFVDHDTTYGTTYYYKITAVVNSVESAFSNEVIAIPIAPTVDLMGMVSGISQISLTWSAEAGAELYAIGRGTSPGNEQLLIQGIVNPNYLDLAVDGGVTYFYEILGFNPTGYSYLSNEISVTAVGP